ncbi:uncharacterized protein LOC132706628 isoform X2 [Cylas formicarius]|uniref:uncharacterized protein LOC132706628 isoform X2 n=1 Tax=Cylas formicarius TaxID=197179 RepID=UPI0029589EF3|nr:uncharacterized protein LOC132706628 isoform X2 [Cylas formicarius]
MTTIKRRSIVSFSKWFMISVGMWTLDLPTRNNALCKVYALYSIFISFYFATFVSSICIQFTITLTTQTTDLETFKQLPFVISLLITHYVTVVIRSSKFTEIITNVVNEENLISISDDEDILNSHLEEVRFNDALSAIFFALTACTGSTLILENFWHNMEVARYNREKNVTLDRPILLHLYYFNVNKRKHETLVLAITEVALVFNTLIIFSTKVIIFTCAAFASSALKNLQIRFRRVGLRCDDALTNLKLLIVEHQGVIEFVKNLNESIRYLLLLEYLLNSLNVAAVSVQFLTVFCGVIHRASLCLMRSTIVRGTTNTISLGEYC